MRQNGKVRVEVILRNSLVILTTSVNTLLFLSTVNAEFEKQPWKKMFKRWKKRRSFSGKICMIHLQFPKRAPKHGRRICVLCVQRVTWTRRCLSHPCVLHRTQMISKCGMYLMMRVTTTSLQKDLEMKF